MRIALVNGGAGGLGLATAKQVARDGLCVAIADLSETAARNAACELDGEGYCGVVIDVANEQSVIAAFKAVESEVGPIAVLAHFAGMLGAGGTATGITLTDSTLEDWDRVLAVNARGSFLCL